MLISLLVGISILGHLPFQGIEKCLHDESDFVISIFTMARKVCELWQNFTSLDFFCLDLFPLSFASQGTEHWEVFGLLCPTEK